MNVAYLNVRTLLGGKEHILIQDLITYKIDIAFISEVRWQEHGDITGDDYQGYHFLNSKGTSRGLYGVSMVLSPNMYKIWKEGGGYWEPISPRLVKIRFPFKDSKKYISFIGVYAPTQSNSTEEEKDLFYDNLGTVCDKVSSGDVLVVLGDFNARVGKFSEEYPRVVGKHGFGIKYNGNGSRLINFCMQRSMCVMNTFFQRADKNKPTWKDCHGFWHMIDHILIQQKHMNNITDIYNNKAIALSTDHIMVQVKFKLNIITSSKQRKHRYRTNKIDYNKLKDKDLCKIHNNTGFLPIINNNHINNNGSINSNSINYLYYTWKQNIVHNNIFKAEKKRMKTWMTDSTLQLIKEKRELTAIRFNSQEEMQKYNIISRRVKKAVKKR